MGLVSLIRWDLLDELSESMEGNGQGSDTPPIHIHCKIEVYVLMIGGPGFLPWVPNGAGSLTFMWITIYNQFGWVAPTRHAATSITIHLVDPTLCKDLPKIQLSP